MDGRADQYALACAAFELLAGEAPFQRDEGMAVIWAHLYQPPPSLAARRAGLPAAVDEVVARALAKAPADRYASCSRFADALREALGLAAYHTGPGDIPAADHLVAGHPGTEVDWPAAPAPRAWPSRPLPRPSARPARCPAGRARQPAAAYMPAAGPVRVPARTRELGRPGAAGAVGPAWPCSQESASWPWLAWLPRSSWQAPPVPPAPLVTAPPVPLATGPRAPAVRCR